MADATAAGQASPAAAPPAESPAQEKARLRRERRAAKIQGGGAARLQAITSVQGGSHRDIEKDVPVKPAPSASAGATPFATETETETATPDPDEIDISSHHYTPASQPRLPSPFAFDGNSPRPVPTEPGFANNGDPSQDPMLAMLQQMMGGGMPGGPGQGPSGQPPDMPPGFANMLQAMQGGTPADPPPSQSSAWLWRLVHSIFSLGLAIYIVLQTPFTGSKLARSTLASADEDWTVDPSSAETFQHFFYLFATFEVVLQSSRYFIEKGQLQGSGLLTTIGSMLPEPYSGYIRVLGRYSVIYSTVVSDAMVVVFVLGAASWYKGAAIS